MGEQVSPSQPPSSPLTPGYFLDRYELLCPLADGGMASVWVARLRGKHGFEKLLAIKTILPHLASDERFQEMFLDEARIASRIEHTNVAQIVDLGEQHDITYLVMEWVDGDSLSRLYRSLKKQNLTLPPHILLRIVADVCGGLHAAHELRDDKGALLGVVHRDVSPQNILASTRGVAKLIDFGIAKAAGRLGGETSAGLMKGKIHYMAPEQALGIDVDRRADIFAVGALLYHYLSGSPPFDGPNQLAILNRLNSKQPPMPLPSSVHPTVAAIIKRCLAHSRDERFATAAELQAALESAMIESRLTCTQAQVADFVGEHGASRTASRKEAIELALSAAAERARIRAVLRPNPEASETGVLASATDFQKTETGRPPAYDSLPPSAATLGSATIEPIATSAQSPRSHRALLLVVAAASLVVAVLAIVFVVMRQGAPPPVAAAPVDKPTSELAPTKAAASPPPTSTENIPVLEADSLPMSASTVVAIKPQAPSSAALPVASAPASSASASPAGESSLRKAKASSASRSPSISPEKSTPQSS